MEMIPRLPLAFVGSCIAVLGLVFVVMSGVRYEAARRGDFFRVGNVTDVAQTLVELKTQASFEAEVVHTCVRESTNIAAEHGLTNHSPLITNLYGIVFRVPDGRERTVAGMNAPSNDISCIKQLQPGKRYRFPDVFLQ